MIKYKKGCLIEAVKNKEVDVIAHQANCFNTFGAGIAKTIKEELPYAYKADCNTKKGDKDKLGTLSLAYDGGVYIFNLYGQYGMNRHMINTDYKALEKALERMRFVLISGCMYVPPIKDDCRIGIPKLGCGLAGGDWNIVEKIVEDCLGGFNVTVYEL